jgi:CRISPR-associated endonuclease/helicase Cas3
VKMHIQAVYSAEHPDRVQIGSMRLLKHQVETREAFRQPDIDVIFNTAMTGDGKSIAAYLPAFQDDQSILALYPTNELIYDQYLSLDKYRQQLALTLPRHDFLHGSRLSQLMHEHDENRRFEEARKFFVRNPILLTNPDLVHLMLSHQYGWQHQRKELAVTVGAFFDIFLFDEFHVFGVPQALSVMNMLGYLLANYGSKPHERKKFIFLSATPHRLLTDVMDRAGIRYRIIEGTYRSTPLTDYRCILQACDLHVHEVNRDASVEVWVREHLAEIHHFFTAHKGSKAAILVYSVATARRLVTLLREYFRPFGIDVGENTGLTDREERRASYTKQILVGTSTVDIGVDFHINYLIFEASNAGSFLQRFGRLGRHSEFDVYEAHALIPRFALERLEKQVVPGQAMERTSFQEIVREIFPAEQTFTRYTQRWGVVQAAQVLAELKLQEGRDANTAFAQIVEAQYEQFYGQIGKPPVMPKALKKYWALNKAGHVPEIVAELSSFRGQSPLSCGIWDSDGTLKTYDLLFLLAHTKFEVLTREVFFQRVRECQRDEREFHVKHFYVRVWEYEQERQSLVLGLRHNLTESSHILNQAIVMDDFFVREPRLPWLNEINKRLKQLRLPCLITRTSREELWSRYHLGGIFPLYRLQDGWGQEYTVAFGEEALLLDSLLFFRKSEHDPAMML